MRTAERPAEKIVELRALLKQRFPGAHAHDIALTRAEASPAPRLSGWPTLDTLGAQQGALTECVSPPGAGGSLLLRRLVDETLRQQRIMALVDGTDSYEPRRGATGRYAERLVWVRCRALSEALQATDLLVRDGNLPLILVDLQMVPQRELLRQPGTLWHRLRAQAELQSGVLLILTPSTCIPAAQHRVQLCWRLDLSSLDGCSESLIHGTLPFLSLSDRGWRSAPGIGTEGKRAPGEQRRLA
jgi:hypothetical protein